MTLTIEDRLAIGDVICRHGHLIDAGELDRLDELFTRDVVYDVSDFTGESLIGLEGSETRLVTMSPMSSSLRRAKTT
jgi:hypothetical protein